MKLIESLIAGEVAPLSPTQFPGQDKSPMVSGKGQEVKIADVKDAAKAQKNPKVSSEPTDTNEQQGGGLLAMMAAAPAARTKPTLTLSFGRSEGEDTFVKSAKPTEDKSTGYIPEAAPAKIQLSVPLQAQTQPVQTTSLEITPDAPSRRVESENQPPVQAPEPVAGISTSVQDAAPAPVPAPISIPAAVPLAIAVPMPIAKATPVIDRPSTPDRPRLKLELSKDSREAPTLPPTAGKVRPEGAVSSEPIAFAARLTEREEPEVAEPARPPIVQRETKQQGLPEPAQQAAGGKPDPENVPTNPKPIPPALASQSSSDPPPPKAKPVVTEHAAENVPTNPKPPAAFAVPSRESAAQGPQPAPKSASAPEVKASAPSQETELQAKPMIRSEPAREISIRIPSPDNGNVDVQIVERDGKVQVTVRGSDAQLNSALRSDLTELVHTLHQKGYKTETWTPSDTNPMTAASAPEVKTLGRSESTQDWSGNQPDDGGNGGNSGGNQQQKRQQQERPDWLIELERRLDTEG